ncbi:DUF6624 domain-containing protein [Cryptosporangium arvum]|uniref:DUF6624 domain-containing protein n=1 Tax=Cryptosporangium arvum TaxID=80871 RepID=UPI0004BAB598|nr:DUF6624 domain-containing protein [Cryptosporangium arvum]
MAEQVRELAAELIAMAAADTQATPYGLDTATPAHQLAWRRLTTEHADRLATLMARHGWPTPGLVGAEASRCAWKIAMHADRQLDVQRRALALLDEAVAAGEGTPREVAMLRDRVLVNEGHPQIYGTQIAAVQDGRPVPWPVADPDRMEELRASVGLPSFADHIAANPLPAPH